MVKKKKYLVFCILLIVFTSIMVAYATENSIGDDTEPLSQERRIKFSDVTDNDWFYDDVQFVSNDGLMSGTGENVFSPNDITSRGMLVTVLWRMEASPIENYDGFNDVDSNKYYYNAVVWAYRHNIVSGYDSITFGPDDSITREQLATIMYRYATYKNYDISSKNPLDKFVDSDYISEYALSAFEWANANGIVTGTSDDTIEPQGNALRSQLAAILHRFCSLYEGKTVNTSETEKDHPNSDGKEGQTSVGSGKGGSGTSGNSNSSASSGENPVVSEHSSHIKVSSVSANRGESVQVIAEISHNPGILGMTLSVEYDMNNLTLEKAESGEVFKDILDMTTSKELISGANFLWDGIEIKTEDIKDGTFLVMTFSISETAEPGKYPITLKYTEDNVVDNDLNKIELQIENGYITVND